MAPPPADPVVQLTAQLAWMATELTAARNFQAQYQSFADDRAQLSEQRSDHLQTQLRHLADAQGAAAANPAPTSSSSKDRPRARCPDSFKGDPRLDYVDVDTWMYSVEDYFAATRLVDDTERLTHVSTMLEGNAQVWWRFTRLSSAADIPTTWHTFKIALKANFERVNSLDSVRAAFANVRQTGSVQDYVSRFRQLMIQLPHVDADDALFRFINNLKTAVKTVVRIQAPATLELAVVMAERVDAITYQPNATRQAPHFAPYNGARDMELGAVEEGYEEMGDAAWDADYLQAEDPEVYERVAALMNGRFRPMAGANRVRPSFATTSLTPAQREQYMRHGLCFVCGKPGHAAKVCPPRAGHPKGPSPSN